MAISDFHPELRSAARFTPRATVRPATLPVIRAVQNLQMRFPTRQVETVKTGTGIRLRLHRPATGTRTPAPAMLWMHGGGYVIGSPRQDDQLCHRFAQRLGITVAAAEYRLAPEHPHPAALDDCVQAWDWLAARADVDVSRLAIGGASAGGGLAAALAMAARDRGLIAPVLQLLAYPMLDDRSADDPSLDTVEHRLWDRRSNQLGWAAYLGGADPTQIVPARRTDLVGLARTWIGVGTLDLFHHECLTYARQLRAAGVHTEVCEVPGAFHAFDKVAAKTPVSQHFFDAQCAALAGALGIWPPV
ncbi:alpha/beta hydrolase domain-containing protein [Mycolicibacterium conceptionense]|uniref:Alpha/beta hydrolase domain-containing protein n=1 Tax=Mycolicibacterium conceptionense TaxID=451644 RepID=A0A0U1DHH3_9MYCO|nr:alpha/beta hydrolase [Mycolicibacterium conceptionense]CQD16515.1 alpha/beta hydrolase domain-containing protein [Mycolicibacterium conceptionense]